MTEETVSIHGPATTRADFDAALDLLGDDVLGLVVRHKGRDMELSRDGDAWLATCQLEEMGSSEAKTFAGRGSILEALSACAQAADAYEGIDCEPGHICTGCIGDGPCEAEPEDPSVSADDVDAADAYDEERDT